MCRFDRSEYHIQNEIRKGNEMCNKCRNKVQPKLGIVRGLWLSVLGLAWGGLLMSLVLAVLK